jgi:hypothetical protein
MVDVRPVRDVDHDDRVLFIVDLVPDTVMSAPSGPDVTRVDREATFIQPDGQGL